MPRCVTAGRVRERTEVPEMARPGVTRRDFVHLEETERLSGAHARFAEEPARVVEHEGQRVLEKWYAREARV